MVTRLFKVRIVYQVAIRIRRARAEDHCLTAVFARQTHYLVCTMIFDARDVVGRFGGSRTTLSAWPS